MAKKISFPIVIKDRDNTHVVLKYADGQVDKLENVAFNVVVPGEEIDLDEYLDRIRNWIIRYLDIMDKQESTYILVEQSLPKKRQE